MSRTAEFKVLHVVLVSPADVEIERDSAEAVINELNQSVMHGNGLHLEVHRWERTPPALHRDGPQGLIDARLEVENSDLVIGIFWSRFGTPTPTGETGTEHELRTAWKAWDVHGKPQVLLYFCERPVNPTRTEDARQVVKVLEFLDEVMAQHKQLVQRYIEPSDLASALRSHIQSLVPALTDFWRAGSSSTLIPLIPLNYLDGAARSAQIDSEFVDDYRREMRPSAVRDLSPTLPDRPFLDGLGVILPNGELSRAGALLFSRDPTLDLPTARIQCELYDGTHLTAEKQISEIRGSVFRQASQALQFVSEATVPVDSPSSEEVRSQQLRSPFPTVCLRETITNAIVHRDYEDMSRMIHLRLFKDRIEVASPGLPLNCKLPEGGTSLRSLMTRSVMRNFTLARLLTYIRLADGAGSGIPMAIEDAKNWGLPEPIAREEAGYTTVTVFRHTLPIRDPMPPAVPDVEFADRRVATGLARVSLDMIVPANRSYTGPSPSLPSKATFSLDPSQAVAFFVPTLPRDPAYPWRLAVTAEDVLAIRSIILALLERWPLVDAQTLIMELDDTWTGDSRNICAICREHRNPVTTVLLEEFRRGTGTNLGFVNVREGTPEASPEWAACFPDGYIYESRSYSQDKALRERPIVDEIVELEDVAMLARFRSPWGVSNETKAMIVAGARAFGTWGAADYLRTGFDELYENVGERDFACRLRVLRKYRVGTGATQQVLLFPTDDGPPTVELVNVFHLSE